MDPNQQAVSDRGIHYNPEFEMIASFGNGEIWDQDCEVVGLLPYQVSYDDAVDPKYPGGHNSNSNSNRSY